MKYCLEALLTSCHASPLVGRPYNTALNCEPCCGRHNGTEYAHACSLPKKRLITAVVLQMLARMKQDMGSTPKVSEEPQEEPLLQQPAPGQPGQPGHARKPSLGADATPRGGHARRKSMVSAALPSPCSSKWISRLRCTWDGHAQYSKPHNSTLQLLEQDCDCLTRGQSTRPLLWLSRMNGHLPTCAERWRSARSHLEG